MDFSKKVIFVCGAAAMGGLLFGFDTAVISGTVELVKNQFAMDAKLEGWFVSSGLLGCILGVIAVGLISDKFDRKNTLILSALLFFISGLVCGVADNITLLTFGRLLGGLGVGLVSVVAPLYISEFSPSKIRGSMVALYQLAITLGILFAYFSNAFILYLLKGVSDFDLLGLNANQPWRFMFLMMCAPALIFFICVLIIPKSPRWLMSKGRVKDALNVLLSVRSNNDAIKEHEQILTSSNQTSTKKIAFFSKSLRYPLFIGIALAIFQQLCGINAIIYYGPKIFEIAGLTTGNALQTQTVIGVVNVLFTLFAIYQADRWGRRPLLIIGLSGIIISLLVASFCFYSGYAESWVLVGSILLFVACFAFSLGPITWLLINEIFPSEVRVKAVSVCTMAVWLSVWVVGQFFPLVLETYGPAKVFLGFALISILDLVFCLMLLKETKGQNLEEIGVIYSGGH